MPTTSRHQVTCWNEKPFVPYHPCCGWQALSLGHLRRGQWGEGTRPLREAVSIGFNQDQSLFRGMAKSPERCSGGVGDKRSPGTPHQVSATSFLKMLTPSNSTEEQGLHEVRPSTQIATWQKNSWPGVSEAQTGGWRRDTTSPEWWVHWKATETTGVRSFASKKHCALIRNDSTNFFFERLHVLRC